MSAARRGWSAGPTTSTSQVAVSAPPSGTQARRTRAEDLFAHEWTAGAEALVAYLDGSEAAAEAGVPLGKADFDGLHAYPEGFSF